MPLNEPSASGSAPLKVLVVDDHFVSRFGTKAFLQSQVGIVVVGEAENGTAVAGLYESLSPDVVVMDLRMPQLDGIAATRRLVEANANAKILIFSSYETEADLRGVFAAGAKGYVKKETGPDELLIAIRKVARGERYLPAGLADILEQAESQTALTPRELQMLELMALGLTNKEIAAELGISSGTVRVYTTDLFAKLQAGNRTDAVRLALGRGLIRS